MRSIKSEIRIGIFVLIFIISLIGFLFIIDQLDFIKKAESYVIEFDHIDKLEIGNYVKLKGNIKVGKISNITFLESKKKVLVNIYFQDQSVESLFSKYQIDFKENSSNFIGASHVDMIIGKRYLKNKILDAPKRYFFAKKDKNFKDSINDIQNIINSVQSILNRSDVSAILNNVKLITYNINQYLTSEDLVDIIRNIKYLSQTLRKSTLQVENIIKTMNKNVNQRLIKETIQKFRTILDLAEKVSLDINSKSQIFLKDIEKISHNFKEITNNLNNEKYPLGYLIKDSKVKDTFSTILYNINTIIKKLKLHPILNLSEIDLNLKNPF